MVETLLHGDVNELQCILDFQKRGYYCSIPFSKSCRYDVVVDINNQLYRIQCKCCYYDSRRGIISIGTRRQTTNTKRTIYYAYSKEEIDYFYTSWNGYGFLIPVEETNVGKYLRVKKPLNSVLPSISVAHDYLIDNVINSIINKEPIKKYIDNRIISIDENSVEKIWNIKELEEMYSESQIRYIKTQAYNNKNAHGLTWKYKEFPTL